MRRDGGVGLWFRGVVPRLAHTWALQATARRFGSVTVSVPVTSRARLTKSGSYRRAPHPAAARGRPPGPRSARPGHRPQPAPSFAKAPRPASGTGFLRHPVPAAPALRLLRTTSASACVASAPKSAAPSSRSRWVRARQGILPVKTLGGGILRVIEVPSAQSFDGSPP